MKDQPITSKFTSINSKKLPAIYNRLDYSALLNYWQTLTKFEKNSNNSGFRLWSLY